MSTEIKLLQGMTYGPGGLSKLEKQTNQLLGQGFEVFGEIKVVKDKLVICLMRKGRKDYVKNGTAYPSEKQSGYVKWAYSLSEKQFDEAKVTRKESSALIERHKKDGGESPFEYRRFEEELSNLRGHPVSSGKVEDDDDIPF